MIQSSNIMMRISTLIVLLCCVCAIESKASPKSSELTRGAIAQLKAGQYGLAVTELDKAVAEDPDDMRAVFFLGVAYNRTGNGEKALAAFDSASKGEYAHRDLIFEAGWANLLAKRYEEALELLLTCEATHPKKGQVQEFIGRCYFELKQYDTAKRYFNRAVARDKRLAGTANLYLARIARIADDDKTAMQQHIRDVFAPGSRSALSQVMLEPIAMKAERAKQRLFDTVWFLGVGNNDNVLSLGDGASLPEGISDRGSMFIKSTITASGSKRINNTDAIVAGVSHNAKAYSGDHEDSNVLSLYGFLGYHRRFGERLSGALELNDQLVFTGGNLTGRAVPFVGNDLLMNALTLRSAATYRQSDSLKHDASLSLTRSAYEGDVDPSLDRNGMSYELMWITYCKKPGGKLTGHAGVQYGQTMADGDDQQKSSITILGAVSYPFPYDIRGTLSASLTSEDYDNANSRSGTVRSDDVMSVSVTAKRKIPIDWWRIKDPDGSIRIDNLTSSSNIASYDYSTLGVTVGITLQF